MHRMTEDRKHITELSSEERRIIKLIRELQYGEVAVSVQRGVPIRAEIRQSVLLSNSEKQN